VFSRTSPLRTRIVLEKTFLNPDIFNNIVAADVFDDPAHLGVIGRRLAAGDPSLCELLENW
jgi:hypothetical protein